MNHTWVIKPISHENLARVYRVMVEDYVGEIVAMVIAESRALAEDAAELVEVDYDVMSSTKRPSPAGVARPPDASRRRRST